VESIHESAEAMRHEALAIFADLAKDIAARLINANWQIEVRDDARKLMFRITVSADPQQ
jgi:cytochrome P450